MNWLKRKLRNWINKSDTEENSIRPLAVRASDEVEVEGLRFNVMKATGGLILQLRTYDRKTDRSNYNTYIITDDEPIAERVGQIVALEILKS